MNQNSSPDWVLHPQLAADAVAIGDLPLCRVLVMNEANWPWIILVPRQMRASEYVREIFELSPAGQQQLTQEISKTAQALQQDTGAEKMNIAALGNMVPQLHIHIIARFKDDPAWPKPVWGAVARQVMEEAQFQEKRGILEKLLKITFNADFLGINIIK